jgi:hypothetical protein
MNDRSLARTAWREPMVWLVAAIPAASVVASVALLIAAARSSGNNDAVADRVQRTAQIQVSDLAPDVAARTLGLAATLQVADGRLRVRPDARFPEGGSVRLALRHPTRADADLAFVLPPGDGWTRVQPVPRTHDWSVTLSSLDGRWRLQGRLPRGHDEARLQPALAIR